MHVGLKFIVCLRKGLFIFHATLTKVVAGSLQVAKSNKDLNLCKCEEIRVAIRQSNHQRSTGLFQNHLINKV